MEDPATPGRKAQWIADAQATLKSPGWEQFKAILYWHSRGHLYPNCQWWVDTSASSLAAFSAMGADPYFTRYVSFDTTVPTVPGQPSGVSNTASTVDLTWTASSDPDNTTLTYRVYRDGGASPVGSVTSASTTTVSFTDTGLVPGSTHTYEVDASDGPNASAKSLPSLPITVQQEGPAPVFIDRFDDGFQAWTIVTNLTIDETAGGAAPPSALGQVAGARAYAVHPLGSTYPSLCMSEAVNLSSIGLNSVALMKLKTSSGQSIGRVFVESTRILKVRGDVSGATFSSGASLPTGWNTLELCITVATSGTLQVSLNGAPLGSWGTDTGTIPIGRLQILDDSAKTFTANVDDVEAYE